MTTIRRDSLYSRRKEKGKMQQGKPSYQLRPFTIGHAIHPQRGRLAHTTTAGLDGRQGRSGQSGLATISPRIYCTTGLRLWPESVISCSKSVLLCRGASVWGNRVWELVQSGVRNRMIAIKTSRGLSHQTGIGRHFIDSHLRFRATPMRDAGSRAEGFRVRRVGVGLCLDGCRQSDW
jgi:hypothetical protein